MKERNSFYGISLQIDCISNITAESDYFIFFFFLLPNNFLFKVEYILYFLFLFFILFIHCAGDYQQTD